MSVNYDYYRIFYYVGKYRSISRAARILENSQPNITRAMNNLESQLGCKLLIRSAKGVELTSEGQKLYEHVSVAVRHITAGEQEIASAQALEAGELFIAATEIAMHRVLLPALQQFRTNYPGVHVRVSNYSTPEAMNAVRKEQAELAVVSLADTSVSGIHCIPITTYNEKLVAGHYYKHLEGTAHSLGNLIDCPWISLSRSTQTFEFYDRLFMERGLSFEPELQAATVDQILPMVKRDLGLAFLPEFIACPSIAAGEIIELSLVESIPERTICLIYKEKSVLSASAKELLNVLRSGI